MDFITSFSSYDLMILAATTWKKQGGGKEGWSEPWRFIYQPITVWLFRSTTFSYISITDQMAHPPKLLWFFCFSSPFSWTVALLQSIT